MRWWVYKRGRWTGLEHLSMLMMGMYVFRGKLQKRGSAHNQSFVNLDPYLCVYQSRCHEQQQHMEHTATKSNTCEVQRVILF